MADTPTIATLPPLTTRARVESAVGSSTPLDVERVDALIARSSTAFRSVTGQDISAGTSTYIVEDDGAATLFVPQIPLRRVVSLTVDTDDGLTLVEGVDFVSLLEGVIRLRSGSQFARRYRLGFRYRRYTITYEHGYPEIPADVAEAVAEHAATAYRVQPGVTAMTLGSSSFTFGGTGSAWDIAVARYRAWLP